MDHTALWARRMKLVDGKLSVARFAGESYARLVARLYPEASFPDLALATDLNSWFHVYDDQFELAEVGRDPELARRWVDKTDALLRGGRLDRSAGPVLRGLADIRDRFRMHASEAWWNRFADHFRLCFETAVWEVENRVQGRIPDTDSYIEHKLNIAYVPPSFDVVEFVEHFDVPEAIRTSEPYRRLVLEAGHVVVCTNDIIGLNRELAQGEFHNLVIVLSNDAGCSLEEAVGRVNDMISSRIERFQSAKQELLIVFDELGVGHNTREGTLRCVTGLEHWMRGYHDWALESRRFSDPILRGQVPSFHDELLD
ncbi:terpene synthase family protein [Sinosporangium album]|uniref:terpene synthase family protein n=1 Tax=Sinosporangium album TaxID=504805 RepID=UPI00115FA3C9|nr:hypothetical protein [Sinosporangium album]